MRKIGTVMGAAALVVAGWVAGASSGCSKAHASESKVCPSSGVLTFELPGDDPESQARFTVIRTLTKPSAVGTWMRVDVTSGDGPWIKISGCATGDAYALVTW